jgi:ADP-heptose:LPS heptosyltransferase
MNLTEKMALDCGVKIEQPYLDQYFLPLKSDKFIIFDTRCNNPSGEYDYYTDVYDLIKKYVKQHDIQVFQFANEKNNKIPCDKCFITINKKHENYLIAKSKLLITNENYTLHIASAFNTKSIGLYSLNRPANKRPIWNKKSQIILESHREGNLPSYNTSSETPKTINFINPYEIAKNILDVLNIQHDLERFDLVYLGKNFHQKIVEIVPDFISTPEFMKNRSVNLRLDYIKNLNGNVFNYWLTNRKVNIITDKDINIGLLNTFKSNILMITVMMSSNISENFLKGCKSLGLKLKLFCDSKAEIDNYRFKFLDWEIEKDFEEKNPLDDLKNINKNSKFISSKILISKGKQFSCKPYFFANKPIDNKEEYVILSEEFGKEIEFFKIYNEREETSTDSTAIP